MILLIMENLVTFKNTNIASTFIISPNTSVIQIRLDPKLFSGIQNDLFSEPELFVLDPDPGKNEGKKYSKFYFLFALIV